MARGEAEARRQKGLAEADVIKATGSSEAEIITLKGAAEAEAMRKKADSYKEYNEAAVLQALLAALPEIAKAVAEPLSKTERITLVSTGGDGTGASRLTGDVAKIMAELPAVIESLSGVDLRRLIESVPALKSAIGAQAGGRSVEVSRERRRAANITGPLEPERAPQAEPGRSVRLAKAIADGCQARLGGRDVTAASVEHLLHLAENLVEACRVRVKVENRRTEFAEDLIALANRVRPLLELPDEPHDRLALLAEFFQEDACRAGGNRPLAFHGSHRFLSDRRWARAMPCSNALISRSQYRMSPSFGKLLSRSARIFARCSRTRWRRLRACLRYRRFPTGSQG